MLPYLFHIYGPIYANSYGIAIAVGIMVFTYLINKNPKRVNLISKDNMQNTILLGILMGVIGGRLLWVTSHLPMSLYDAIEVWEGGLSVLGSIIAVLLTVPFYLRSIKVPILPLLDLVAIYTPLLHSISRIGCFMAGCCYGMPTNKIWGIIYTHPDVCVPIELKNIAIHPTQIYSSLMLMVVFLLMYYVFRNRFTKPGQLISIFLMLSSTERFMIDFWRADQEFFDIKHLQFLAIHQWISLGIFVCAALLLTKQSYSKSNKA
jgi:phosphatidylglycerol:prolipoprotein diacylglycerol transferase